MLTQHHFAPRPFARQGPFALTALNGRARIGAAGFRLSPEALAAKPLSIALLATLMRSIRSGVYSLTRAAWRGRFFERRISRRNWSENRPKAQPFAETHEGRRLSASIARFSASFHSSHVALIGCGAGLPPAHPAGCGRGRAASGPPPLGEPRGLAAEPRDAHPGRIVGVEPIQDPGLRPP